MRTLLVALCLPLVAACANSFGGDGGGVVLANRTARAFLYVAFDLADAPLVDPNPAIDPAEAPERLVAAGEQRTIEVPGDSGEGVLLFLYEIPSQDHAGPVPLSRTVRVPAADLRRLHNRIVIDEQ
jgi:hypothetical protein